MKNSIKNLKFNESINEALYQAMHKDNKIICYGLGVTDPRRVFNSTKKLVEKFGEDRVFDIPTSENALTGVAIGLANMGSKVIFSHQRVDFSFLSMDQIVNNLSKWYYMFGGSQSLNVTIRLIIGRGWGQGPTHSQSFQSMFAKIPGLKVVMPSTPYNAKGLLLQSIADPNPVIFFEHRWLYNLNQKVPKKIYKISLDKSELVRKGKDLTIITMSYSRHEAVALENFYQENKIDPEIIDLISISKLDMSAIIRSVKKTRKLLILDTCHKSFSTGKEIISNIFENNFNILKKKPILIGLPDTPTPTGFSLTKYYYPTKKEIKKNVCKLVGKKIKLSNVKEIYNHDKPNNEHEVF